MVLDELELPIVLAPLAGGPSRPALVAAVCEAGAFGFLASGYLTPAQLEEQLRELRSRTRRPFGVNVFTPAAHASDPAHYAPFVEQIRRWAGRRGLPVGGPARWLLPRLRLLAGAGSPLIAAGGLMSGSAIAAALAAGARAAQHGTAFLLCPEAGTAAAHRAALREAGAPTRVTRAFTGRAARGIVNA